MEINKKNISMSHTIGKQKTQITVNEDINVPDSKGDIYKKIVCGGDVIIENVKTSEEKVAISGKLKFNMLYQTEDDNNPYDGLEGTIDIAEVLSVAGISSKDYVKCKATLEDISIALVNSRKISVSAVVTIEVSAENTYVTKAAIDMEDDSLCVKKENLELLCMVENKKDILRVKKQQDIEVNKPNVDKIVWSMAKLHGIDCKCMTDELMIRGDMNVFVMYTPEKDPQGLSYYEEVIPFTGKVPLAGAKENMIALVNVTSYGKNVNVKPDYDGEPRMIEIEMALDLDIKVYEEEQVNIVTDVYSIKEKVNLIKTHANYDCLLVKNHLKCKLVDKYNNGISGTIMQIINCDASIGIDEISVVEDGLMVEGAAKVDIIYISDNDDERIGSIRKEIPFSQKIEALGIEKESFYTVKADIEQENCTMSGNNEIEIKLVAGIDALVLRPKETDVITDIECENENYEELRRLPGAWGYIVKAGDSLWDIAKDHHTTMDKILETNNLTKDAIKPGCKLLIIKETAF